MLCLKIIFVRPWLKDKITWRVVKYRHISHPISFNWHRLKHLHMNSHHSKCVAFAAFAFWHRVPMWGQIWFFILWKLKLLWALCFFTLIQLLFFFDHMMLISCPTHMPFLFELLFLIYLAIWIPGVLHIVSRHCRSSCDGKMGHWSAFLFSCCNSWWFNII